MPWPILSLITVLIVFTACVVLTELLARTRIGQGAHRAVEDRRQGA